MAACVECEAEFDIDEPEVGEIVSCPECGLEMEVLRRAARRCPGPQRSVRIRAMGEQSADHLFIAAHDRLVERGEAGRGQVRVGAFIEKKFHQLSVTRVSGKNRGGDAPSIGIVHVGACSHEELRRAEIADARRKHQGRISSVRDRPVVVAITMRRHSHYLAPDFRASANIGAMREQHLHDIGMLL